MAQTKEQRNKYEIAYREKNRELLNQKKRDRYWKNKNENPEIKAQKIKKKNGKKYKLDKWIDLLKDFGAVNNNRLIKEAIPCREAMQIFINKNIERLEEVKKYYG